METKQFIEKAIEGGWTGHFNIPKDGKLDDIIIPYANECVILLDPLAWQAVGKMEGWDRRISGHLEQVVPIEIPARNAMRRIVDALCEGKTLEEFLKTL